MSFQDLERGIGQRAPLARDIDISPEEDLEFRKLSRSISLQIHKINSNTAAINRLVELLGSNKDGKELRTKLRNLLEVTRDVLKDSTQDLQRFTHWQLQPGDRSHKQEIEKVSSDFKLSLAAFQNAQKKSAEKQRLFVERAKAAISSEEPPSQPTESGDDTPLVALDSTQQQQQQQYAPQVSDAEIEYQEQLISEREGEIAQIEAGITELNQIFGDLAVIVSQQGDVINNIEQNISNVAIDTERANDELVRAHEYQRRAGRRGFCLFLAFIAVVAIVLLAVSRHFFFFRK